MPPEFYKDDFDLFIEEFQAMQLERSKSRLVVRRCWPAWVIEAEASDSQEESGAGEGNGC